MIQNLRQDADGHILSFEANLWDRSEASAFINAQAIGCFWPWNEGEGTLVTFSGGVQLIFKEPYASFASAMRGMW